MDPVELRIINEPERNPEDGTPFSTRKLVDCLRHGAELFGWEKRNKNARPAPRGPAADRPRHGGGGARQSADAGKNRDPCSPRKGGWW